MKSIQITLLCFLILFGCNSSNDENNSGQDIQILKAVILDGSNNHYIWPKTTQIMKSYLEETDLFEVTVVRMDSVWYGIKYNQSREEPLEYYVAEFPIDDKTRPTSSDPINTSNFELQFDQYDLIVLNLGAFTPRWPEKTEQAFATYMRNGGGLVVVHAANNAWGDWNEFNEMIGVGAWGDRDSLTGPFVYYNEKLELEKDPIDRIGGSHGLEHEYVVTNREPEHPILKGLPTEWLHTQDELYDRMRGPFKNATILATAYSDPEKNAQPWEPALPGTGKHVGVMLTVDYGQGRVFHSTMGHFDYSMECVGFMTTLQRGAEWAATGNVTLDVPTDFPTAGAVSSRNWGK